MVLLMLLLQNKFMKRSTLSILIIAIAALQSCYKNNAYDTANRDIGNLFQISVDKDSVLADGSSLIEIKISGLPEKISDTDNKASLETDNGLFDANGTKNIDISSSLVFANNSYTRVATTKLKAESKVKVATIKVTMKAVAKTYIVRFYKAPPERVKITPSLIFFTPSFTNPVTFEVALTRSFGIPTQETSITVQVTNLNGAVVGTFRGTTI